jgi:diadenosine tetraphosphate (Ap4A) HIT family hydrolase
MMHEPKCPLCRPQGERVLWRDDALRVILAADETYPAFCRVIWSAHVREMTDLDDGARAHFMRVVFAVERALRASLSPDKINLASLGNQVLHLHWHVIPRFADDAHFPDPVWAARQREGRAHPVDEATLAAAVAREAELGQSK